MGIWAWGHNSAHDTATWDFGQNKTKKPKKLISQLKKINRCSIGSRVRRIFLGLTIVSQPAANQKCLGEVFICGEHGIVSLSIQRHKVR